MHQCSLYIYTHIYIYSHYYWINYYNDRKQMVTEIS